jgi:hypothetical protein
VTNFPFLLILESEIVAPINTMIVVLTCKRHHGSRILHELLDPKPHH